MSVSVSVTWNSSFRTTPVFRAPVGVGVVECAALELETAQERQVVVAEEVVKPQEIKLDVTTAKVAQPRAWRVQPSHESVSDEVVTERIRPFDDQGRTAVEQTIPTDEGPSLAKVTGRRLSFSIEQVRVVG